MSDWEQASDWYDAIVGNEGHVEHQETVLPNALRLLGCVKGDRVLDLGCGQGVLARALPSGVEYVGVDNSPTLLKRAQERGAGTYVQADLSYIVSLEGKFTHAAAILVLQNMPDPSALFQTASQALQKHGRMVIVLNHPCFRIPRQSHWGWDDAKKTQYRRVDRYLTPLDIPIQTNPSRSDSSVTHSFHRPLSFWVTAATKAGFSLVGMEEWTSTRTSTGERRQAENRARKEFPLFLALIISI